MAADKEKVPITSQGFAALEAEIRHLKAVERPRIIAAIAEARGHGDLSENAEYHAAKEEQGRTEGRVLHLEDQLRRAQVIDTSALSGTEVKFGATVSLREEESGARLSYRIVGAFEADARAGRISIVSPLARALIGKSKGDVVQVDLPSGERVYEILKVSYK